MFGRIDQLQVVVFGPTGNLDALVIWQALFGTSPDSFTKLPTGGGQAQGIRDGYSIALSVQPGRLDMLALPEPSTGDVPPAIDDGAAAGALLFSLVKKLPLPDQIERVAIVCPTTVSTASLEAAAAMFRSDIGLAYAPPAGTSELFFQSASRKVLAECTDEAIVICRWSVNQRPFLKFDSSNPLQPITNSTVPTYSRYVDVATVPSALSPKVAVEALGALGREVARLLGGGYERIAE
jgi:hypothetical protein